MKVVGIVFVALFWGYLLLAATMPLWLDPKPRGKHRG